VGCGGPAEAPTERAVLDPLEHARRVSMAVRGLPLTDAEIDAVVADPQALPDLLDGWLDSEAFGDEMRDLHAASLWTRVDTDFEFPALGPLAGTEGQAIVTSVGEGPLRVIEEVIRSDLPYSDILAVDWTMTDGVLAKVYGLPFDPAGPAWQRAAWPDGRPAAGLLSDNGTMLRYRSSDTNFERERANAVTRLFLCQDFASADLPVLDAEGGFTSGGTGPLAEPACAGCHAVIDPIGSYFWGFRRYILPSEVRQAYEDGCAGDTAVNCYPFRYWIPENTDSWADLGMPAPAFQGSADPGDDLADLGRRVAGDPAFSTCAARRFGAWLTQTEPDSLPDDVVEGWAAAFDASGRSAKALVRTIALDPALERITPTDGGWAPGLQHTRPEQWARTVEALTGFRFLADPTPAPCAAGAESCWGEVDLLRTDRYGFRMLLGGISGYEVTEPTLGPTPTRTLALERAAFEAAGTVVPSDLSLPAGDRKLLGPDAGADDETSVRAELVHLHRVLLGEVLDPTDPEIDGAWLLWSQVQVAETSEAAWMAVVAGLLLHPAMVAY
jgi:hypothetical protein